MIKATIGGERVEILFTPSFTVKTTDKRLEGMLRNATLETYDPWRKILREVKPWKSEKDAFLFLSELSSRVPEMKLTFEEAPEVPNADEFSTEENPTLN